MKKAGKSLRLRNLFSSRRVDDNFFDELEDVLIEGDLGAVTAIDAVDTLRKEARGGMGTDELRSLLTRHLSEGLLPPEINLVDGDINFFLILGVNGVGKTTSLAKLADYYSRTRQTEKILLCAGDTFRAGAIDQLKIHGERLGYRVVSQDQGSDPGAVIYDSLESAITRRMDFVFADTAGRMHNKQTLVQELQKISGIVGRKIGPGMYHKMLVIDANTGQNGLRQAEVFHEAVGVDSIFLAKYDSSAKGGIVFAISKQLGIPVSFVGTGEKVDDISPFH
ncbi:MAG: signal recognition particle-docking protein FtsY, partial [Spirochaetales bacterium]|nr:signal recognition particle-docking protein FtsY [Spirochaetales bacterium]